MRRAWLLLPALTLASACFPSRNNVHDPSRTPDVELALIDTTAPDGTCTGTPIVTYATKHRRCLVLSAAGSSDPQGTDLEYRFFAKWDENRVEIGDGTFGPSVTTTVGDAIFLFPVGQGVELGVEVRDEEGAIGRGAVAFVRLNTRPDRPPSSTRIVPIGGHPWAPGPITLDIAAGIYADADGDALQYCWSIDGATEQCGSQATLPLDVDTAQRGVFVAALRVNDGSAFSPTARHVVRVEEPVVWNMGFEIVSSIFNPGIDYVDDDLGWVERLSTASREYVSGDFYSVALIGTGANATAVTLSFDEISAAPFPAMTPAAAPLASDFVQDDVLAIPGASAFWHVGKTLIQTDWKATRYDVTRNGTSISISASAPTMTHAIPLDGESPEGRYATAADGTLWVLNGYRGSPLLAFTDSVTEFPLGATDLVADLDVRPGTSEVWAMIVDDDFIASPRIRVQDGLDPATAYDIPLPGLFASSLSWIDTREAWIYLDGLGLCLVDFGAVIEGESFASAILQAESIGVVVDGFADPATGQFWGQSYQQALPGDSFLVRGRPGENARIDIQPDFSQPRFIAPDGRAWIRDLDFQDYGLTSDPGGERLESRSFFFAGTTFDPIGAVDPETGGLWVWHATPGGSRLSHLDVNGHATRSITTFSDEDGVPLFPSPTLFTVTRGQMVAKSGPAVFSIALSGTSDTATVTTLPVGDPDLYKVIARSGPASASDFLWYFAIGNEARVVPLANGTPHAFAFPTEPVFAASPITSGLCSVWELPGTQDFGMAFLRADGTQASFGAATVLENLSDSEARMSAASWVRANGNEACWFGLADEYREEYEIFVYDVDGTRIHRLPRVSDQGVLISVAPITEHSLWALVADNSQSFLSDWRTNRYLVEFEPVVGSSNATMTLVSGSLDPNQIDGVLMSTFGHSLYD